ncbi:arsenate reductase (glutaredoxin) [Aliidiomarina sp. Khilg15.8]
MSEFTILHNPRCSKSRETLQLLQQNNVQPHIIEYLKEPPSADELRDILRKLGRRPAELIRNKEAVYKELELAQKDLSDDELIQVMTEHPKLIERPVVIRGDQARVGRPPEQVLELL